MQRPPRGNTEQCMIRTDADALALRYETIQAGLIPSALDPFTALFCAHLSSAADEASGSRIGKRKTGRSTSSSSTPLMRLGTHVRHWAIDTALERFFDAIPDQAVQVLNLGAGTDVRFFRTMHARRSKTSEHSRQAKVDIKWIECDLPTNTAKKISTIRQTPALSSLLLSFCSEDAGQSITYPDPYTLLSPTLSILPLDLSTDMEDLMRTLRSHLDPTKPTFILAECSLVYLPEGRPSMLLENLGSWLNNSVVHIYEMIGSNVPSAQSLDRFGSIMVDHLQDRGIQLPSLAFSTETHTERLQRAGFDRFLTHSRSLFDVRRNEIPAAELERVNRLLPIDEWEELDLVLQHYVLVSAAKLSLEDPDPALAAAASFLQASLQVNPVA